MGKIVKKISAAFLAAVLCISALAGCGSQKIDGTKAVLLVGEEKVPLGAAAFLARYQQAQIYQLYSMYFGQTTNIFSQEIDGDGKTYADEVKEDVLDELTDMMILRQHAGDYKVELTDEEKQAILDVGLAYENKNSQEVREKIGANKEHVSLVAELELYKAKMMEAMAGDIDENVDDKEAQQSTVTYVKIEKTKADASSDASTASDASAATESTASEESSADKENAEKKAKAEELLKKLQEAEDPAAADADALAKEVDESYSSSTGQFTTNDTDDTELPAAIVTAAKDLKDGEIAKEVVEDDDAYYVVRMDKVNDADKTEDKKEEILKKRKQDNFDEKLKAWKDATTVSIDDSVWKTVVISDTVPFDLGTDSSESTDSSTADSSTADSSAADSSTADSSTADSSTADSSAADSSAADSSATDSSVADSSAADSSVVDSSVTDSSVVASSAADSSVVE